MKVMDRNKLGPRILCEDASFTPANIDYWAKLANGWFLNKYEPPEYLRQVDEVVVAMSEVLNEAK